MARLNVASNEVDLRSATAVVTGGGSGIGLALVRELAARGCAVVVADIDDDAARAAADEVCSRGGRAIAVEVDVSDPAQTDALAEQTYAFSNTVEIVCNNAGVFRWGDARHAAADEWDLIHRVNVNGVVNGVRSFLPRLLAQATPAHIVNTASYAGFAGRADLVAYSASKAALISFSEALRDVLADTAVRVCVLCPASINTSITTQSPDSGGPDSVSGLDPCHVARDLLRAIADGSFYVFTYPRDWRRRITEPLERRHREILDAIARGGA